MTSVLRTLCVGFVASLLAALVSGCASSTRKSIAPAEVSDDSAVVARIALGGPPNAIAVTPDGSRAYVTSAGNVFVIDTAGNSAVGSIPLPRNPAAIAISGDGSHAYVADFSSAVFWVIDTATDRVTATVDIGPTKVQVPATPAVAVSRDGTAAYITNPSDNTLTVVDMAGAFVRTRIALHMRPSGAAVTPDGSGVYVSGCAAFCTSGVLAVVDTRTYVISDSVPTSRPLSHIAVSPNGKFAYAPSGAGLLVVDTHTNNVIAQIPGDLWSEVNITADGARVYVHGSRLAVIDAASKTVAGTIPLPSGVGSFAMRPDGTVGYFASPDGLYVIDTRLRDVGSR
jgi:YVTN family beta-propeller protein